MRKGILFATILSLTFLVSCKKVNKENKGSEYTVTKEQYDLGCYYRNNVARMTSLNFTVYYDEYVNDGASYRYVTTCDNGKVISSSNDGDFYLDFKAGTYNSNNLTWSYDGYFEEGDIMRKMSYENAEMPDDVFLPDVGSIVGYDELKYNSKTNSYEQIAERKTLNDYYIYSDVIVKFLNGNVTNISYKEERTYEPGKIYSHYFEIANYGSTVVNLPSMIEPA